MKRLIAFIAALCVAGSALATTLSPIQLLNPAGSSSGQAIVSTGSSSAPTWGGPYAALTGATFTGPVGISTTSATETLNDTSGTNQFGIGFQSASTPYWALWIGTSTKPFLVQRYVSGVAVDNPISISSSTGVVTMTDGIVTGLASLGTGSTIATSPSRGDSTGKAATTFYVQDALLNPPAIGSGTPAAGSFTTLSASSTLSVTGASTLTGGINGVTNGSTAGAGIIGQIVTSNIAQGSAVALTTATPANVTSISLPAGDWMVWGYVIWSTGVSTVVTSLDSGINTTSGSLGTVGSNYAYLNATFPSGNAGSLAPPTQILNLSSTTTIYLVAQASFTTSTCSAYGFITAMRFH